MKKVLLFLTLLISFIFISINTTSSVNAATSDALWGVSGNVLTISPKTGKTNVALDDYTSGTAPWYSDRINVKSIVISEGITKIGDYSFYRFNDLISITFPSTITSLGTYILNSCDSLTTIDLSTATSLSTIANNAFEGVGDVTLKIPSTCTLFNDKNYGSTSYTLDKIHYHTYDYTINNNTITATCTTSNCGVEDAVVTASLDVSSKDYNNEKLSASITNKSKFEEVTGKQLSIEYYNVSTKLSDAPTTAGTYTVKMLLSDSDKIVSKEVSINKMKLDIPSITSILYYNGNSQTPTWQNQSYFTITGSTSGKDAGTYYVFVSLNDKLNTCWTDLSSTDKEASWKINKKVIYPSDITWTNLEVTFDGKLHSPTGTINATALCSGDVCTLSTSQYTGVDSSYQPNVELSNPNYVLSNSHPITFKINPMDITSSIVFDNKTIRYDGETHTPTISSTMLIDGYPCYGVFTGAESNPGTYTATLTGLSSPNYTYTANPYLTCEYTIIPTYEIDFNLNSSFGNLPSIDGRFIAGDEITLPYYYGNISLNGKSFIGWNTNKDSNIGYSGTYIIKDTDISNNKITFYPIFKDNNHTCNDITFNVILNNNHFLNDYYQYTLESGYYYLNDNLTLDNGLIIESGKEVHICLCGYVLDLNNYNISNYGYLYLYDCQNNDEHIHYFDNNNDNSIWTLDDNNTSSLLKCIGGVIYNGNKAINSYNKLSLYNINFIGNINGAVCCDTSEELNIYNCNFISNIGNTNGGAIEVNANTNIYDSTFKYNKASTWGGAIIIDCMTSGDSYIATKALISGCIFEENSAAIGAAIYVKNSILTLSNTSITNNTATYSAGGVYLRYDTNACLVEGTLITMDDGSFKSIEDLKEGDLVKSFNHLTGEYVDSKVYLIYKGNSKSEYFTLNFKSGNSLSIVGVHDLFNKEENKYVRISSSNYSSYIGKHFFDATNNTWDILESVTLSNDTKEYYSIYTESTFNVISNNMLTIPNDVDFEYEIFEFNNDLTINQDILNQDIKKYGLLDFNDCEIIKDLDDYNKFNAQYYYIWLGKLNNDYISSILSGYIDLNYSNDLLCFMSFGNSILTYDTYGNDTNIQTDTVETWLIVCDKTVIKDNIVDEGDDTYTSNLLFDDSNAINLYVVGTEDVEIGLYNTSGSLKSFETSKNDYRNIFTCDKDGYALFTRYDSDNEVYYFNIEQGYKIIYNANGGTGTVPTDSIIYESNESITFKTNTLTKKGYAFKGWALSNNASTNLSSYSITSTDATNYTITLYAVWGEKKTINVLISGKDDNYHQEKVYFGETPVYYYTATDSLTDLKFKWDTSVDGVYTNTTPTTVGKHTGLIYRDEDDNYKEFSRAFTLVIGYKVTYNANGAQGSVPIDNLYYGIDYTTDNTFPNPSTLSKLGYTFYGWNTLPDGTGTIYLPNTKSPINNNTVFYAMWANVIDEEPSSTNDYKVKVLDAAASNTYQWYKGNLCWNPAINNSFLELTFGINNNNNITSGYFIFAGVNMITFTYKGSYTSPKLRFKSTSLFNDISLDSNGYYNVEFDDENSVSLCFESEFNITDVELYDYNFIIINNETSPKIINANEDCLYKCIITSPSGGITSSHIIKTNKIVFDSNSGEGTLPSDIYQLSGRSISLPKSSLTKDNKDFIGWATTADAVEAINTFNVLADTTLYAVWKDKQIDTSLIILFSIIIVLIIIIELYICWKVEINKGKTKRIFKFLDPIFKNLIKLFLKK